MTPREALVEGVSDAVGFVAGALAGWQAGRLLGFDVLASPDWNARSWLGLAFVLAGCGAGKWAALRWRARRAAARSKPPQRG